MDIGLAPPVGVNIATGPHPSRTWLTAPPHVPPPNLDGLLRGTTAKPRPQRLMDAVYYDTRDLRLARSGVTLRCTPGDSGPDWTVELPVADGDRPLAHREIGFAGRPGEVPGPAADLVLAFTRARSLKQVAHLAIARRPVRLQGPGGQILAEVTDDMVSLPGGGAAARWREAGVEVHARGPAARRLREAVLSRLIETGYASGPGASRLARAVGDPANRPSEVIVESLAAHATIADVIRHAIARSVAQVLRHDPGTRLGEDPEDLHQLRVGIRRLRSDLRTFAAFLEYQQVAGIRGELRWLGGQVGLVRDSDVLTARIRAESRTLPEADSAGAGLLLRHLDAEARDTRAAMLTAMRSRRYVRLLNALVQLAAAPLFTSEQPALTDQRAAKIAAKIARQPWERLSSAIGALGPVASDADLHQVRILTKRCRYAAEAVTPVVGGPAARFAHALSHLQTVLGDHQDTVVAETWLRQAAAKAPDGCLAAGQLIALERAHRTELRARWPSVWQVAASKKLRRWLTSPELNRDGRAA
jgi:CHAD domain-containing protein